MSHRNSKLMLFYGAKGSLNNLRIKSIAFPGNPCVVDKDINCLVFVSNHFQELLDAFALGHVKFLRLDGGFWVFGQELLLGLFGQLEISACHNDLIARLSGEVVNYTVPNAFVGAGNDYSFGLAFHQKD